VLNSELGIYCACISTGRAKNVKTLEERTGLKFTYFTKSGESEAYTKNGASNVVEVDGNICKARNVAISEAGGKICLQVSDDYRRTMKAFMINGVKKKKEISFLKAIELMLKNMVASGSDYCGVATTSNILNYNGKGCELDKLIVNDCVMMGGKMNFDESADLKEDYDMFVRQVRSGAHVLRLNCLLMDFPHRENDGGANTYRTTEREDICNRYVMRKHEGIIVPHVRRKGQVQINYKQLKK
jgi:hypothetical protein